MRYHTHICLVTILSMVFASAGFGQSLRIEMRNNSEIGIRDSAKGPVLSGLFAMTFRSEFKTDLVETPAGELGRPLGEASAGLGDIPAGELAQSVGEEVAGQKFVELQNRNKTQPLVVESQLTDANANVEAAFPTEEPVSTPVQTSFIDTIPWWGWAIGGALLVGILAGSQSGSKGGGEEGGGAEGGGGGESSDQGTVGFTW
ncbi:MAG: hypothetical protein HOK67_22485 [Deltaproteobacteria bacterium]|nr:hypothetical protein [Deltaproteobacteria bacterium]MBT6502665.1 hypothetical protein [Deltaproteobacteria bacterium]MBT6613069.1 hypothetical protein [Deltaproteobacteria bacterium]MBT7154841.1 hypothetical protein [Deltaproteobacteria bacterium]MBT7715713.1 hypothetical protein [Deltaproteobacteria bacterium]